MNRVCFTMALGALLFLDPSCSKPGDRYVGEYVVDLDASPSPMENVQSSLVKLNPDMTYGTTSFHQFPDRPGERQTTEGTWALKDGTITLTQTRENGQPSTLSQAVTATVRDGVMRVFLDGEPASVYRRRR